MTSLQISPDTQTLLSNARDSTVRTWDIRPFAPADRRIRTFDGAPTGDELNLLKASWDKKGERIAAGGGDQAVAVWDANSGKLLHKLPGHRGAVNDVRFSPGEEPLCKLTFLASYILFCPQSGRPKRRLYVSPVLLELRTSYTSARSVSTRRGASNKKRKS